MFEIERDSALRGWWVSGQIGDFSDMESLQEYCRKHTVGVEKDIFIPDSVLRRLIESKKAIASLN